MADLCRKLGVVTPLRLIKIDRQEIATVILKQRVDADSVPASQMVIDHGIRHGAQLAVSALTALDARFFANTSTPLVSTGRAVA